MFLPQLAFGLGAFGARRDQGSREQFLSLGGALSFGFVISRCLGSGFCERLELPQRSIVLRSLLPRFIERVSERLRFLLVFHALVRASLDRLRKLCRQVGGLPLLLPQHPEGG